MATFPDDILREIFFRLSIRPLGRFRCICKSWKSLLTKPPFIKAYIERSIKLDKFDLLKYDLDNFSRVRICYSPENQLSDLDISFIEDGEKFKLIDSYNGIIFLWNPSTSENIALSQPSFHVFNFVGFGFDPTSGHPDDFKVVNVNFYFEQCHNYTSLVDVYSFRRNCWKQLSNIFPPSLTQRIGNQVIFENFICWCSCFRRNHGTVTSLILFDVVNDVFREIALPDMMPPEEKHIGLLDGCLSLTTHNSLTRQCEEWILKEFSIRESWTKLFWKSFLRKEHACGFTIGVFQILGSIQPTT
ncbi:hypothetical protein BT93_L0612 [Corymbia citriodora subsp. variegata]|uniref:F-box domain-containing protein n=1 Tax=Corymbia citriodora subsp. variegata TaxID=360336 RepID=A0A8T0CPJ2_CORYI|nr:hypothetical protein BT93_L0612 [Corymbia citriodora subsp. variegata]